MIGVTACVLVLEPVPFLLFGTLIDVHRVWSRMLSLIVFYIFMSGSSRVLKDSKVLRFSAHCTLRDVLHDNIVIVIKNVGI